jgi:hypothetical protein
METFLTKRAKEGKLDNITMKVSKNIWELFVSEFMDIQLQFRNFQDSGSLQMVSKLRNSTYTKRFFNLQLITFEPNVIVNELVKENEPVMFPEMFWVKTKCSQLERNEIQPIKFLEWIFSHNNWGTQFILFPRNNTIGLNISLHFDSTNLEHLNLLEYAYPQLNQSAYPPLTPDLQPLQMFELLLYPNQTKFIGNPIFQEILIEYGLRMAKIVLMDLLFTHLQNIQVLHRTKIIGLEGNTQFQITI